MKDVFIASLSITIMAAIMLCIMIYMSWEQNNAYNRGVKKGYDYAVKHCPHRKANDTY